MKRETKYRAWDKKGKRLLTVFTMAFDVDTQAVNAVWCAEVMEEVADGFDIKDVELLEFTGLKDKNGKEIYDGEVVKWRSHPSPTKVGQVAWGDSARWEIQYQDELDKERNHYQIHGFSHINSIEVIGNIYEHPYLFS